MVTADKIGQEDIIDYGFEAQVVARFPVVTKTYELSEEE